MKYALQPGIEGAMDGKVQWLLKSDNKFYEARWRAFYLSPKSLQCMGGR